uniref:Plastid lipid-associated protein/fibrillin conserved domain-containing protein n=1 Tax=Aegilops tauschii subsp. strangulata TaxID=200361 RepID=A0A453DR58_AEGTS
EDGLVRILAPRFHARPSLLAAPAASRAPPVTARPPPQPPSPRRLGLTRRLVIRRVAGGGEGALLAVHPAAGRVLSPIGEQRASAVAESVKVLKEAAKTRKVPAPEVLAALAKIKKAKLDTSAFFETLGGTESPGRTWKLIFTAQGSKLGKGSYFPVTAVQRFDAAGQRIENGVYLGRAGSLSFEGRLSWKKKILAFVFERVRLKLGPLGPLEIPIGGGGDVGREPSTKDPFFLWFYVDEEVAVAQGKGGGTAFWCRCKRVD